MMSKTQWFVLLCCFVCYLLFGASVFYAVESKEEELRLKEDYKERRTIEVLLIKLYQEHGNHTLDELFSKISNYCDKPLGAYEPAKLMNFEWTFYHSVFYAMTIVSTIGYGNLSPSTPFTKSFMILYGLIGIPLNGMVFITLGSFFGKTFLRLYRKLKTSRIENIFVTLGLVGQLILYISFGITLFIFVPSIFIVLYEKWSFDIAIEFTFGTLTTIGAGQTIPGTMQRDYSSFIFTLYRIFLLLWILIGLGYVAMLFGFITRALHSKKIHAWEHKLAVNIKKTNKKIRLELRAMLNEYLLSRIKRVYSEKHDLPILLRKSQSCPDLRYNKPVVKIKKRAFSECEVKGRANLVRIQSDSELNKIDKVRTFSITLEEDETDKFILRVASALGNYIDDNKPETPDDYQDSFVENKILGRIKNESEMRPRAASESRKDKPTAIINMPWYTSSKTKQMLELKEKQKYGKTRSRTLPTIAKPYQLIKKLRNTFTNEENPKSLDVESQISQKEKLPAGILEKTSIAEFIDALTAINLKTITSTKVRHCSIAGATRRESIMQVGTACAAKNRRFSICQSTIPEQETKAFKEIKKVEDFKFGGTDSPYMVNLKELKRRPKRISFQDLKEE